MEVEQDYLMRMIKQAVKALVGFLLGKENAIYELPLEEQYKSSEGFFHDLLDMINEGKINEAENILLERMDSSNQKDLCDGIAFYNYLNELDDEFLKQSQYSREEVYEGLKGVAAMMGMKSVVEALDPEI